MGNYVQIDAKGGGRFAGWLALPDLPKAPGVVLVQYICGVNEPMRRIADRLASDGFVVLVPDLYWRIRPGVALNNDPSAPSPDESTQALALNQQFDDEKGVADLRTSLDWLRTHPQCNGRAGVLGYCLGGRMAYLMAARSNSDANVGYYGVNIRKYLAEAARVSRPLMLHFAESDNICLPDERAEIIAALQSNSQVSMFLYEKMGHQFALSGGPSYDRPAGDLADMRSITFLRTHLGS
jgi:carboxymethylenebutenolidase